MMNMEFDRNMEKILTDKQKVKKSKSTIIEDSLERYLKSKEDKNKIDK